MSMQEPCPLCGVVEWAHGVKYEQQRIIKLLEEMEAVGSHPSTFDYISNKQLIALIKVGN